MKPLKYYITVRDKNGKLYKTEKGNKVSEFKFEDKESDENLIHLICLNTFEQYKTICKKGSIIDIEVRYFNELTRSYPLLYSFYGAENRFIKH